jgi:hypothetical protein
MKKHGLIFNVTQYSYLSRPLGGHRIASFLRQHDWDIEVVDWANWWSLEQLQEFFKSRYNQQTSFVGFGHLFSIWPDVMEQFASWLKQNYPHVVLVSGSSVNPMFLTKHMDWYIQGFGENAILELLKYCAGNGPRPKFHLLGSRKIISAISNYPAFPMNSLMVKYEDRDYIQSDEWLTVELARGCKFQCAFCQFPVLGVKEDTSRDSQDFKMQLTDAYDRFGVTSYMIADETVNDRIEKISKFADVVETLDFVPWFSGYIRLDLVAANMQQQQELLRMNLLGHFYGVESMNTQSGKSVGKGMKSEKIKDALTSIRNYFQSNNRKLYRGHVALIAGLPFETEQTLFETVDWLVKNWQGQSFGIHPLSLPSAKSVLKQSDMSKNIMSYGYSEMNPDEVKNADTTADDEVRKIQKKGMYREVEDEIFWQNDNMNIFDAQRIVREIYEIKKNYDFRPGPLMINYKLKTPKKIEEILALDFLTYESFIKDDVDQYITKKLNN